MLRCIQIQGYRSLRDLRLSLSRVNVITSGNGMLAKAKFGRSIDSRAYGFFHRL